MLNVKKQRLFKISIAFTIVFLTIFLISYKPLNSGINRIETVVVSRNANSNKSSPGFINRPYRPRPRGGRVLGAAISEDGHLISEDKAAEIKWPTLIKNINPALIRSSNLKYILQWTESYTVDFRSMGVGQSEFVKRKCEFTNCFVTDNRLYLGSYTNFDAIVFAWPQLKFKSIQSLPEKRSQNQKYVFESLESPIYYPLCNDFYNGYFNWTWTYKFDSDSRWWYVNIWDTNGTIIGSKKNINWLKIKDMDPVPEEIKKILKKKTKTAAWFVSNCHSKSKREDFVKKLRVELKIYGLDIDIYGGCGSLNCSRSNPQCNQMLEDDYFFYLSFENSFAEDYVTEKLLTALNHNTVPIVYGGANYSRFMPDGIYLDALSLGVEKLAHKMNHLINNLDEYTEYFRWKKHYSYDTKFESQETDYMCHMCGLLNDKSKMESVSIVKDIVKWWNPPNSC